MAQSVAGGAAGDEGQEGGEEGSKGGSQLMSHDTPLPPWISCEIHSSLALGGDEPQETLSLWGCRGPAGGGQERIRAQMLASFPVHGPGSLLVSAFPFLGSKWKSLTLKRDIA